MKLIKLTALAGASMIFFASCSQDESINPQDISPAQLASVVFPGNMALDADYFHPVQAVVSGPSSGLFVKCVIIDAAQDTLADFYLFDDAGAILLGDGLSYTSSYSGDIVAGDGIFTLGLNSLFTEVEVEAEAVFLLLDEAMNYLDSETAALQIYENQPPSLTAPNMPDTLISGFTPFNLETAVSDAQGLQDIAEVKFSLPAANLEYLMSDPENDGIYTYYMAPEFAAGKAAGLYFFSFSAVDSLLAVSPAVEMTVYIENTAPVLTAPALYHPEITTYDSSSDSLLTIPEPGDTLEVVITVNVSDLQTVEDIEEVYVNIERPTGVWTFDYPMADNGLAWDLDLYMQGMPYLGDEIAGDGIYTTTKLYTSSVDEGLHLFHFQAEDGAGQAADSIAIGLRLEH